MFRAHIRSGREPILVGACQIPIIIQMCLDRHRLCSVTGLCINTVLAIATVQGGVSALSCVDTVDYLSDDTLLIIALMCFRHDEVTSAIKETAALHEYYRDSTIFECLV